MSKSKLRIFIVDETDARLRLLTVTKIPSTISSLPRNQSIRIGPYTFRVYDGGPPGGPGSGAVFDVPNIGTSVLTYPVAMCSDDPDALIMTEARIRKLIVDHTVNPEIYDDDEDDEEEDDYETLYEEDDVCSEGSSYEGEPVSDEEEDVCVLNDDEEEEDDDDDDDDIDVDFDPTV
jgi:hypothetical protein